MATIVNNPSTGTRYRDDSMSVTGWVVALVVLALVILFGVFVWPGAYRASTPATGTPSINVTAPAAQTNGAATTPGTSAGSGSSVGGSATAPTGY